jgi:hypothetical protein
MTDVVWPETKQIGIIDSVFRNFYIPPIIFGEACQSRFAVTSPDSFAFASSREHVRGWFGDEDMYRWETAVDIHSEVRGCVSSSFSCYQSIALRFMDGFVRHTPSLIRRYSYWGIDTPLVDSSVSFSTLLTYAVTFT